MVVSGEGKEGGGVVEGGGGICREGEGGKAEGAVDNWEGLGGEEKEGGERGGEKAVVWGVYGRRGRGEVLSRLFCSLF